MTSDRFRRLIPELRELEQGLDPGYEGSHPGPGPLYLLSFTRDDEIEAAWTALFGQWTIANWTRAATHRNKVTPVYKGYFIEQLGKQPVTMNLTLQYAPLGHLGMIKSIRRRYGGRWEKPLLDLEALEDSVVTVRMGKLNWGRYLIDSVQHNLQHLILLQTPFETDVPPRVVQVQISMKSVEDKVTRIGQPGG